MTLHSVDPSTAERPLTVTEMGAKLRSGELSSLEVTRRMLEQADRLGGQLGSYLARFDEAALAAAERADDDLDRGIDRGPMQGIPVGIKDILAAKDGATTAQGLVLDPAWGEGKDAPVVARLREAGAVIMGKTTTMEFATGLPDPTKPFPLPRNPWNVDHWTGGSSSGTGNGAITPATEGAAGSAEESQMAETETVVRTLLGISGLAPDPAEVASLVGAFSTLREGIAGLYHPRRQVRLPRPHLRRRSRLRHMDVVVDAAFLPKSPERPVVTAILP